MKSLHELTYRGAADVLKHLCGGSIGFDIYRDPQTKSKDALLAYISGRFSQPSIDSAIAAVSGPVTPVIPGEPVASVAIKPADSKPATSPDASEVGTQIGLLLAQLAAKPSVDKTTVKDMIGAALFENESTIREIADKAVSDAVADALKITRVEVFHRETGETKDAGVQHKSFTTLLAACQAILPGGDRLNIWLKGPAGSGKTTAAGKVAEVLGLAFHFNGAIDTQYALMGFVDAAGRYHRTAFREAFEHGGVYLFDEVDSSSPSAVLAFNAALANGLCCFPDGMIKRHKDCVVIAGANTTGNGATSEYVGRMKQDAAFLDRFVVLNWELDEGLELAISCNQAWTKRVQKIRTAANNRAIKNHLITPRASLYGAALLGAGLDQTTVEGMVVQKGLSQDAWEQISC